MSRLTKREKGLLSVTISVLNRILGDINNGNYQINSGIHLADVDEREVQKEAIQGLIEKLNQWRET
jgi:hypothetical protein